MDSKTKIICTLGPACEDPDSPASWRTARLISRYRPRTPIVAVTPRDTTRREGRPTC